MDDKIAESPSATRSRKASFAERMRVAAELLEEIVAFLQSYSEHQGNAIEVRGVVGAEKAMKSIKATRKAFAKQRA